MRGVYYYYFFFTGLFYIFVGGLALGGEWYEYVLAICFLAIGIVYFSAGCCKGKQYVHLSLSVVFFLFFFSSPSSFCSSSLLPSSIPRLVLCTLFNPVSFFLPLSFCWFFFFHFASCLPFSCFLSLLLFFCHTFIYSSSGCAIHRSLLQKKYSECTPKLPSKRMRCKRRLRMPVSLTARDGVCVC